MQATGWGALAEGVRGVDDGLVKFLCAQRLSYPLETKDEFIAQMARVRQRVNFRGRRYDVSSAAQLVPDFFFPVTSEADLLVKVGELLMARGLAPLAPGFQ